MTSTAPQTPKLPRVPPIAEEDDSAETTPVVVNKEFQPKKQQKVVQQWKRDTTLDRRQDSNGTTDGQAGNAPNAFGYVPFKTAPIPIYGNRANPNGGNGFEVVGTDSAPSNYNYPPSLYQPSPRLPRSETMLTDTHSRPPSELALSRLPSRYQSYTTLPRPEHVNQLDASQLYGTSTIGMPRLVTRAPSAISRASIYGTLSRLEKRPISNMSGNKSLQTMQTEIYVPRVASKLATAGSIYGIHGIPGGITEDDPGQALQSVVQWNALNLCCLFQVICGLILCMLSVVRVYFFWERAHTFELAIAFLVFMNGLFGMIATCQQNYTIVIAVYVISTINIALLCIPFYLGMQPYIEAAKSPPVRALTAQNWTNIQDDVYFHLSGLLALAALVSGLLCVGTSILGCNTLGSTVSHVERLRLQSAINKNTKEMFQV